MHPIEVLLVPLGRALRSRHADPSAGLTPGAPFQAEAGIALSSPSFAEREEIPARHCGLFIGQNVSPALVWDAVPADTVDLLLVVEDIDSPARTPRVHAIAAFAPIEGGLAEGALDAANPAIRLIASPSGRAGYAGPRPIPGHGPHRYCFQLYALDTVLHLSRVSDARQFAAVVDGHVLAAGKLVGIRES